MNIFGWGKTMIESHTGTKRGFVILNANRGLWQHVLYPTEQAARNELATYGPMIINATRIVPATQKIEWETNQ